MSVKDQVLEYLENHKKEAVSGEMLAGEFGCSRAAVSKAVKTLIGEGYEIEAVTNKGYTLRESADTVSAVVINKLVDEAGIDIDIICEKTVTSTNDILKGQEYAGIRKNIVLIAEEQTLGRGRRGRSFYSPAGTGLYISFLLHPDVKASEAAALTTMAVTAEAIAVEKVTGINTQIKWVNDLLINGRKVSGILTEASTSIEDGSLEYAVVGIGINLYEPEGGFPEEIKDIAGAVYGSEKRQGNLKNKLAAELIIQFMRLYEGFKDKTYFDEYEKRCFVIGKEVEIVTPDHKNMEMYNTARVLGINRDCNLLLEFPDGKREYMSSGEISIKL